MTTKLKKELVQQRRGGNFTMAQPYSDSTNTSTEAVNQVEQTTGAAVQETGQQFKRGVSRTVTKAKKDRQWIKEQPKGPKYSSNTPSLDTPGPSAPETISQEHTLRADPKTQPSSLPPESPATASAPWTRPTSGPPSSSMSKEPTPSPAHNVSPKTQTIRTSTNPATPKVRTETIPTSVTGPKTRPVSAHADPTAPKQIATTPDMGLSPAVPTPRDRMLQQAMDTRREQIRYPEQIATIPENGGPAAIEHYGKPAVPSSTPTVQKGNLSPQNQSIYPSIKERPRRSSLLKEKPSGKMITPKTRQNTGHIIKGAPAPKSTPTPVGKLRTTKHITDRARRKAQKEAQRGMAKGVKRSAKAAVDLSRKATAAVAKATAKLIGALSALVGGATLTAALCIIFLVGAVIASPFGILFANEPSPGAVPLNAAVAQINIELSDRLALLQSGDYDSIDVQGTGPNWTDVTAVFACKIALGADSVDVAALTPDRVTRLKTVFWDMCAINTSVETIEHPATDSTEAWTEKILHITITPKTADDMRTAYLFTGEQNNTLTELLAELNGIGSLLGDLSISQKDATELLRRLPEGLSPERRAIVETACKLVGKVNYFWGGKSRVIGWDSRWGTIQKVWAAGSSTTGTYRPFGLDCSGFTDWVFYNISGGSYVLGHGGGAHTQHTYCTAITWDQAQPGDLVFYPGDTHVGIIGGWDKNGNILIIHCSYSANNVVITGKEGFTSIGRPMYYSS